MYLSNTMSIKKNLNFKIKDTGIGISESGKKKTFFPFEREEQVDHFIEGTGLGLSIVKKLLELMEGDISCESLLNKGTQFSLELPAKKIDHLKTKTIHQHDTPDIQYNHLKVLVVDDNSTNLALAEARLQKLGVYPTLVDDGFKAIEALQKGRIRSGVFRYQNA